MPRHNGETGRHTDKTSHCGRCHVLKTCACDSDPGFACGLVLSGVGEGTSVNKSTVKSHTKVGPKVSGDGRDSICDEKNAAQGDGGDHTDNATSDDANNDDSDVQDGGGKNADVKVSAEQEAYRRASLMVARAEEARGEALKLQRAVRRLSPFHGVCFFFLVVVSAGECRGSDQTLVTDEHLGKLFSGHITQGSLKMA